MFEVRDSANDLVIKTRDAELADLVSLACSIVRQRVHQVFEEGRVPFEIFEGPMVPREI